MPSDYAETCARLKEDIVEVGRRIYNLGFVAANDGNISVRTGDNEILTTPTGVSKGFMTPDMIIKVDMAGNQLEGELKPSSELRLHLKSTGKARMFGRSCTPTRRWPPPLPWREYL